MLLDITFSSNPEELNEVVRGDLFRKVASEQLGFETGVLYFADPQTETLGAFSTALKAGLEMPHYEVAPPGQEIGTANAPDEHGTSPNTPVTRFHVSERPAEERQAIARARSEIMTSLDDRTTADICYRILSDERHRRSRLEERINWVLIPHGERAVFFFEWALLTILHRYDCTTREHAASLVLQPGFIEECWKYIYENPSRHRRLLGSGERDYHEAIGWLKKVLDPSSRGEFQYLWAPRDGEPLNWFIRGSDELVALLENASPDVDFNALREVGRLVVKYAEPTAEFNVDSVAFYRRSRLSPLMEMLLGSGNLVAFLLTAPMEPSLQKHSSSAHAFLLASFYEGQRCIHFPAKLKTLFYTLAVRDIVRYSQYRLSDAYERVKRTTAIVDAMRQEFFMHELSGPVAWMNIYSQQILKKLRTTGSGASEELRQCILTNAEKTNRQYERARQAADAIQSITNSLVGNMELVDLCQCVRELIVTIARQLKSDLENIRMEPDYEPIRPAVLLIKETFQVILYNLILNSAEAIRESGGQREGVIRVSVYESEERPCVCVADNGPGIPDGVRSNLFRKFVSTKRKVSEGKNLGLGLFLCKNLAALLQAEIRADNQEQGGALFELRFQKHLGRRLWS